MSKRESRSGRGLVLALSLSAVLSLSAGAAETKRLTYGQVFLREAPQVLKPLASAGGWFDDETYLRTETDEKTKARALFKVSARTGQKTLLLDYSLIQKKLPEGLAAEFAADQTADTGGLLYSFGKDLYFYAVQDGLLRRLTQSPDQEEKNPTLSPDGRSAAYTRAGNLFIVDIASGAESPLTSDGSATVLNGYCSWIYYEEILQRQSRYKAFWWSPDSRRVAFLRFDDSPVPEFPLFRSGGPHGELEVGRYPKAGDPNPWVKLGIASVSDRSVVWADFDDKADHYLAWPFWLPDSSGLTVQWLNREQDNLKIYSLDLATGAKSEVYDERQPAWVEFFEDLYYFKDKSGFLARSDKSGRRQLYYHDIRGKLRRQLATGDLSVVGIRFVDEKRGVVYFSAQGNPTTEVHLYRVKLRGGAVERLTREPGVHMTSLSAGGSYFLDLFSNIREPARQDLRRSDGTLVRTIDQSRIPALSDYGLGKAELFSITTSDGLALPASWVLPPDFDPAKKYPVLFSIYSGPGTTDVSNTFPPLYSFYLAQEGIIVFRVDHRGSSHFDKKGVSLMHRNLGKWELHDLTEAVKWLRAKPFVDPARMGITGGSYGGYMTCLAMTAGADYFTHGLASSSVTDWPLYDSVYVERYMDKPQDNPEGYKAGSVLTHADKLKGVLLLEHGDMDDNVHMQNTVQLMSKLMDAGKDFEFMLYPDQRHGFRGKKRDFSNREEIDFWMRHFFGR